MRGAVEFSPAQQQVIDASGWVTAVAGAGAGNTGLLVGRILQSLERGTRPSEILTVTFCTTAAAELRHRVTRIVRDRARQSDAWQSILWGLPLLGITTIHGLCYRVVTEHPVESGAGFGLTVLDDVEWGVYREQKLALLLTELPPDEVARIPGKKRSQWLSWLLERPEAAQRAAPLSREAQAAALSRLFTHVDARLTQLKREEGLANFADLERWAAMALTHERVRNHYAERIREILIDELQDTSPAQWEILQAIAGAQANVVTVGDEKQAIYGFRGGDTRVFGQAQTGTLRRSGEVVQLLENYRSSPALVAVTNAMFGKLLEGSLDTPFAPIRAVRTDHHTEVPAEYHQVIEGTAASRAETLGRVITARFQSLLGHPVLDRSSGKERPARWQDMALLIRSRTHLGAYENALRESGVPYVVHGGRGLFTRPEVREAIDLLAAVTDPADDLLLISVLRGTYFRWSEGQLLSLAQQRDEHASFWQTLERSSEMHARRARALLEEWRTLSATRSAAQLLHEADQRTGFSVIHAAQDDGDLRLGNLQRLREVVYRWGERGRGTVASVAQHCQALRRLRHTRAEEPEAVGTQADAVQILTVHQAKGLEWPIVAYADAVPNGYHHVPPLILEDELGIILPRNPHWRDASERLRESDQREETRLLYVACTRARDRLIMGSSLSNARLAQNKAREIQQSLPSDVPQNFYVAGSVPSSPPLPTPAQADVNLLNYRPGSDYILPGSLPVTALQRYADCPRQFAWHDLAGLLPLAGKWTEAAEGGKFPASTVGDAVHRALQHGWSERQIYRRFAHLPEAMRSEVVDLVGRGRSDQHPQLQHRQWQRELPVSLTLNGQVWQGVVDAYDPTTRSLLDYKTDQDIEPERHLLQMALYAHALNAHEVFVFYLRHNQIHRFGESDLRMAIIEAGTLIDNMQSRHYQPNPQAHCKFCSFRGICDSYGEQKA